MQKEILSGHFGSVEELLGEAIQALRANNGHGEAVVSTRTNLAKFLLDSPFGKSDLNLERQPNYCLFESHCF